MIFPWDEHIATCGCGCAARVRLFASTEVWMLLSTECKSCKSQGRAHFASVEWSDLREPTTSYIYSTLVWWIVE